MTEGKAKRGRGRPRDEARRRCVAELRAQGWTLKRIALHLGVTHQNVSYLLKNRRRTVRTVPSASPRPPDPS
jgi:hypothetical protein